MTFIGSFQQTARSLLIWIKHQSPRDCRSFSSSFVDRFGSKYRSNVTGIIYNDEMDDFNIPNHNIVGNISPSPFNFPARNKRPFSSISPAILTNDDGDVQLVIGASGGKRITTAVSLVCLMASYFEQEKMNGRKVHPPYRSYSEVYHFLVIFRSRYKNKWSKTQMRPFFPCIVTSFL